MVYSAFHGYMAWVFTEEGLVLGSKMKAGGHFALLPPQGGCLSTLGCQGLEEG